MRRTRNNLRKIKILLLVILLTVILFITATYAWLSTQKDVEITGMKINVEVAESMQISLDGETWNNSINIEDMRQFYGTYSGAEAKQAKKPNEGGNQNYVPTELLPVSSIGTIQEGKLKFVYGTVYTSINGETGLKNIKPCDESDLTPTETIGNREENNEKHPFLAFDMYLRNISAKGEGELDILKLDTESNVWIGVGTKQEGVGVKGTGLEYSSRVAFIPYNNTVSATAIESGGKTVGEQVRELTADGNEKVAIWEPNDLEHTPYVVANNDRGITTTSQAVTTLAIKDTVTTDIANIYNAEDTTNFSAPITMKPMYNQNGTTVPADLTATDGITKLGLKPNTITKVRVYIWLEGQDPDCVDLASTGDRVNATIKLTKDKTNGTDENTYVNPGTPIENASEITGTDGEFKYVELENGEIQITRYIGNDTEVVIPATYDGRTVYSIGNIESTGTDAYHIFGENSSTSNSTITKITISEGIKEIKKAAFLQCVGLTGTLTLPSTLTAIDNSAFRGCINLTGSINIPEGVRTIGYTSFYNCTGFTGTLTLPNTLTEIGSGAFASCESLTGSINIPESVTTIGYGAFQACYGFNGTLTLPSTLTEISDYAFNRCYNLTGSLSIPEGVTTIGIQAFQGCGNLNGTLTLPSTLTHIKDRAFIHCSGLTGTLRLPSALTQIDDYAFQGCSGLTGEITITEEMTLGQDVFTECDGLTIINEQQ